MKKSILILAQILIFSQLIGKTVPAPPTTLAWSLKKSENGVSVYSRSAENSKYNELKVVFQVKTSLSSLVALLNDVESYPKWIYHCESSKLLKKDSDKHLFRYQKIATPWPVDSRDMAVEVNSYQDEKTKIVYQKITAVPDYIPQSSDYVRIRELQGIWTLKPLKNGMVQVEYELLVNPAGSIPAWVINMAAVDGPYQTSIKMKELVMNEKYQKAIIPFVTNQN